MEGGDEELLNPVLSEVKTIIEGCAADLRYTLGRAVGDVRNEVLEMREQVDVVSRSLSATREIVNNLALGSFASFHAKRTASPIVEAQLQSSELFLKSEVISAVSISSITKYVISGSCDGNGGDAADKLRLLLFAPVAQARKKARMTDIGRRFVEMRTKIIRNMVYNCQVGVKKDYMTLLRPALLARDLPCGQKVPSDTVSTEADKSQSNPESGSLQNSPFRAPAWTEKGFITRDDVDSGVGEIVKQEVDDGSETDGIEAVADGGLVQTQTSKRRKTIVASKSTIREQISKEIVKKMWKRWTAWFANSRAEARRAFTLDLGVAFLHPTSRWKPICSCGPGPEYDTVMDRVPRTEVCSVFRSSYETISANLNTFRDMLKEFPNLLVTCQYTVIVFQNADDMANDHRGQEVTMRRTIHLLRVAANFLIAYFQVSSLESFLGGSSDSLRLVLIVALSFSGILHRASRPRSGGDGRDSVSVEAKELGLLIPGDVGRLNFLMEKCLKMTREKYDAINVIEDNGESPAPDLEEEDGFCSDDDDVENIFV